MKTKRTSSLIAHTIRTRDGGTKELRYGRKQSIYLNCMECLGWEDNPRDCTSPLCALFPFRGTSMASQRSKAGATSRKDTPHISTNTPHIDGKPLATTE